jgi:hypothetical protein
VDFGLAKSGGSGVISGVSTLDTMEANDCYCCAAAFARASS